MASFLVRETVPGSLWVEIVNPRLAAAIRALSYAWSEAPETPDRTEALIAAVEQLFTLTATAVPTQT